MTGLHSAGECTAEARQVEVCIPAIQLVVEKVSCINVVWSVEKRGSVPPSSVVKVVV